MATKTVKPASEFSYGIEIECTLPHEHPMQIGGYYSAGIQIPGLPRGWVAKDDSSINPKPGFYRVEIVSPILRGHAGLRQVLTVCAKLEEWGVKVNATCGLHVHVGWDSEDVVALENFVYQMANHEQALFASTGTKKREVGTFSKSIKETWRNRLNRAKNLNDFQTANTGHYGSLNLSNLIEGARPTVEIRAFAGTASATKICGHIQMAIALVQKGMKSQRRPNWDAPAIADSSRSYRKAGPGSTALARLYYVIGWTKGVSKDLFGYLGNAEGLPSLKAIKKEFSRLGRKYDKATR